jgi:SAM-dependent methyltransferase
MKKFLKQNILFMRVYGIFAVIQRFLRGGICRFPCRVARFATDYSEFIREENSTFKSSFLYFSPYMEDKTAVTPLDPTYFFQDTWAAGKIFRDRPAEHHDVGSSAMTVGILSQFVPTTMIDIRSIDLKLPGLTYVEGSILSLPFKDNAIHSLSSLCVIEHIGLGRYGDAIDAFGSEKAASELQRVLAVNGNLYISLPVDCECRVYFNAHRAFTRDYVIELFGSLVLEDEKYHYGRELVDKYDPAREFGTGLFHFRKC